MDSTNIALTGFLLTTPASRITADFSAGIGLITLDPSAPFRAQITTNLNSNELLLLYPSNELNNLKNRELHGELSANGSLRHLTLQRLVITSPELLQFSATGQAQELTSSTQRSAVVDFTSEIHGAQSLWTAFSDSAIHRRIALPQRLALSSQAGVEGERYTLSTDATIDSGRLQIAGGITPKNKLYNISLRGEFLPMDQLLPTDSLGLLDFTLTAEGSGFDPLDATTRAAVQIAINRLDYRGIDWGGVLLDASLAEGHFSGRLIDHNEALRLGLQFHGIATQGYQQIDVRGNLFNINLQQLKFTVDSLSGALRLDASAAHSGPESYATRIALDSITIQTGNRTEPLQPIFTTFDTDSAATRAGFRSGDLQVAFSAPGSLEQLQKQAVKGFATLRREVPEQGLWIDSVRHFLPPFELRAVAGRENLLSQYLRGQQIGFDTLQLRTQLLDSIPQLLYLRIEELSRKSLRIDSLTTDLHQQSSRIVYAMRLHTAPESSNLLAAGNLSGEMSGKRSNLQLQGHDRRGTEWLTGAISADWNDTLTVEGSIRAEGLQYDTVRIGNLALMMQYHTPQASLQLHLDSTEIISAQGSYQPSANDPLTASAQIPGLPLQAIQPLLPADWLQLQGSLHGAVRAQGNFDRLTLDGGLHFAETTLRVPTVGTSFRLSDDTLRIERSRLQFNRYALLAPNGQPLTLDGAIDLRQLNTLQADLRMQATDFQAVNVARRERTAVSGRAYLDLDATARGPFDALTVRGRAALREGTDLRYTLPYTPDKLRESTQEVVRFTSWREVPLSQFSTTAEPLRIGGIDLHMAIDIEESVRAAVDLSAGGDNRIEVRGGGALSYTINPLGDMRLTGRYTLTGGVVQYNPPILSQKRFEISPGGSIDWTGDPTDPRFDLTATERLQASVTGDGGGARTVAFVVAIHVRNTLSELSISFDLSAPEDSAMQNELASLTAEQRATQAMNLLLYGTYTGIGSSARIDTENPLNQFITNELNRWAQNSLGDVDLRFGIRSYDVEDPAGQRTDYTYRLSKNLFGNRVRAVIGGGISTNDDPTENLRENLIDDLSIEYLINRSGSVYLRVFRHTNYESILEGEITETGVGIVLRKRLSRLGELFRPARQTKTNSDETSDPTN